MSFDKHKKLALKYYVDDIASALVPSTSISNLLVEYPSLYLVKHHSLVFKSIKYLWDFLLWIYFHIFSKLFLSFYEQKIRADYSAPILYKSFNFSIN